MSTTDLLARAVHAVATHMTSSTTAAVMALACHQALSPAALHLLAPSLEETR